MSLTVEEIISELQTRFILVPRTPNVRTQDYYAAGNMEPVIDAACNYFGVPREVLMSSEKGEAQICHCRYVICHIAHRDLHVSFSQIARILNRNHASIIAAVNRVGDRLEVDKEFRYNYNKVKDQLAIVMGVNTL